MLRSLHIENIAVIKSADLELNSGFSALTGETGAGKSMIIDSINLLLGNRASREILRSGESYATVSAVFDELSDSVVEQLRALGFSSEDRSLMLQRTLHADGKTQTRLDGRIITQSIQRQIAQTLISIHGQSDSQKLLQKKAHRDLLDAYADTEMELSAYQAIYHERKDIIKALERATQDESEKLRRIEMLEYQIEDIDALKLQDGEEGRLIAERDRLIHLEQINRQVRLCTRALKTSEKGSAYDLVRRAQNALDSLDGIQAGVGSLSMRLDTVLSELEDIAETVEGFGEEGIADPTARIDRLESRLEAISKLKRKYGSSIGEILAYRQAAKKELETLELSDEHERMLKQKLQELTEQAQKAADILCEKRKGAAKHVVKGVTECLSFLDMPRVRFEISLTPCELSETGADDIEFLIATNPGEPLLPMIKIASGGELSRIMLALRSVLHDKEGADTVIFDEIDAGVSGKTSRKIGIKLKEAAKGSQVLCVTHSAQIASLSDAHYRITKNERDGRAETEVLLLDEDERIEEIARILGGIEITEAQRRTAQEMIQEYR